jgi:hypothetical protein
MNSTFSQIITLFEDLFRRKQPIKCGWESGASPYILLSSEVALVTSKMTLNTRRSQRSDLYHTNLQMT